MSDILQFSDRAEFRAWLEQHGDSTPGRWLLFGKKGGPVTLTAAEALEEALCFGWIDGQMQSLDSTSYKKYFAPRTKTSSWSNKNKALAQKLIAEGKMTPAGLEKIEQAQKNGGWDSQKSSEITAEHIRTLSDLLKGHEPAYSNFGAMSDSVKKTYARGYFDAKTQAGRQSRLDRIIERTEQNLKPM